MLCLESCLTPDQAIACIEGKRYGKRGRCKRVSDEDAAEMARLKDCMTYREIAGMFGVSAYTVHRHVTRVRKAVGA